MAIDWTIRRDLPSDVEAERRAIGAAVLLHGKPRGKALLGMAGGRDFLLDVYGWYWGKLKRGAPVSIQLIREFKARFDWSLGAMVSECLEDAFYWNGEHYIGIVVEKARQRRKVLEAARALRRALEEV